MNKDPLFAIKTPSDAFKFVSKASGYASSSLHLIPTEEQGDLLVKGIDKVLLALQECDCPSHPCKGEWWNPGTTQCERCAALCYWETGK